MGKMPTNSLGKSSELKLHCFCLFDAYSMHKDMRSEFELYLNPSLPKPWLSRIYFRLDDDFLWSKSCNFNSKSGG